MKNLLFIVAVALLSMSAQAISLDAPIDHQLVAAADMAPVYVDPGLTEFAPTAIAYQNMISNVTVDPGDPCPAIGALAANRSTNHDRLPMTQGARRMPIANALYASLFPDLKDEVPK